MYNFDSHGRKVKPNPPAFRTAPPVSVVGNPRIIQDLKTIMDMIRPLWADFTSRCTG